MFTIDFSHVTGTYVPSDVCPQINRPRRDNLSRLITNDAVIHLITYSIFIVKRTSLLRRQRIDLGSDLPLGIPKTDRPVPRALEMGFFSRI